MRTVVSSYEIPHLWAHKAQADARNSTRNFYFRDSVIYSYGPHFPIARHVTNKRNQAGILFTLATHSKTTAGHCRAVRAAIPPGVPLLYVPEVPMERDFLALTLHRFEGWIGNAQRNCFGPTGRFRPKYWSRLDDLVLQANAFAEFFGSRKRWDLPPNAATVRDAIDKQRARDDQATKLARKRALAAQAKRDAELAGNLEAWRNGDDFPHYGDLPRNPVALRLAVLDDNGSVVETSLGANVPIDHARLGLRFVRKCRDTHTPYQRNGHTLHLGHYAIDSIDEFGNLTAGCHRIAIEEIERIAPLLEA